MSRTKKSSKSPGTDFWSRRCFGNFCMGYGKSPKEITKRKERARDKEIEYRALHDPDNFEGRFPGE